MRTDSGRRGLLDALPHLSAGGQLLAGRAAVTVGGVKRVLGRVACASVVRGIKDGDSDGAPPVMAGPATQFFDPALLAGAVCRALEHGGPVEGIGPMEREAFPDPVPLTETVHRALDRAAGRHQCQAEKYLIAQVDVSNGLLSPPRCPQLSETH
ncbi:hypothetical protein [Streptomyces sp. NPDC050548]|uniref:hypothetical protein n=1 Tax=Streptomyces sp. NPDC050548 TaxID=3365629 RepID=UPI00379E8440